MDVLKQFNLARTSLLQFVHELDEDLIDQQSPYFDRTIRWYLGNILYVHEKFLFVSEVNAQKLSPEYRELFSSDIHPKDCKAYATTLKHLISDLEDQQVRINNFNELFWRSDVKFKVPYGTIQTHGDLLIMLSHRESEILGKIKMMRQVLQVN